MRVAPDDADAAVPLGHRVRVLRVEVSDVRRVGVSHRRDEGAHRVLEIVRAREHVEFGVSESARIIGCCEVGADRVENVVGLLRDRRNLVNGRLARRSLGL